MASQVRGIKEEQASHFGYFPLDAHQAVSSRFITSVPSTFKTLTRLGHHSKLQATHQRYAIQHLYCQMQMVQPHSGTLDIKDISSLPRITVWLGTSLRSEGLCTVFISHTLSPPSVLSQTFFLSSNHSCLCPLPGFICLTQLPALLHRPCNIQ